MTNAMPGSIWKLSEPTLANSVPDMDVADVIPKDIVEVVVCPLEAKRGYTDFLELHFRHQPPQHDLDLITNLFGTFALCWSRRAPGLIAKKLGPVDIRDSHLG